MAYGVMNRLAYWILPLAWGILSAHAGLASRRNLGYLPPIPEIPDQQLSSSILEPKNLLPLQNSYTTTTYNTNHISPEAFQTSPQLSGHKSVSSYSRTYHNSYAPQPSGIGKHLPPPPTPAPLPSLIPKSVIEQFTLTSSSTFPSGKGNSIESPSRTLIPLLSIPQLPSSASASASVVEPVYNGDNLSQPPSRTPSLIMFDSPTAVLTPSQNETIQAAKLLATSLLQVTGDTPIEALNGFNVVDANNIQEKDLNSTDVLIVKAQKNAYIIPMKLPTDDTNPKTIQELYNMRDKLDKAYTINQFIFIIKPERINFLNKLV